jgi:NAD(P)-dependent dehydrogenase (short-subunit alcohol dehydrogenase family)
MPQTVLITGASTGIGRAAAHLFHQNGWNVVATMRSPETETELTQLDRLYCVALDVTDPASIQAAVDQALQKFSAIDVLINNAGYALTGAFEGCTPAQIERQFATNVFGLMTVTRTVLPHFRARRQGTLINVASVGGRITFPLYSLYHSTKWAIEGFSESLQYELEPLNIRVKIIEPGAIKTDFYKRSIETAAPLADYAGFSDRVMPRLHRFAQTGSPPEVTAQAIYRAATDGSKRMRYAAGGNAGILLFLRKLLSDGLFRAFIRSQIVR